MPTNPMHLILFKNSNTAAGHGIPSLSDSFPLQTIPYLFSSVPTRTFDLWARGMWFWTSLLCRHILKTLLFGQPWVSEDRFLQVHWRLETMPGAVLCRLSLLQFSAVNVNKNFTIGAFLAWRTFHSEGFWRNSCSSLHWASLLYSSVIGLTVCDSFHQEFPFYAGLVSICLYQEHSQKLTQDCCPNLELFTGREESDWAVFLFKKNT